MKLLKTAGLIAATAAFLPVRAQDIHFSQFYQTPLLINPALTGAFHGDHRILINYKDQWRRISDGKTYVTMAMSYDFAMFKKKWKSSYLGGGIQLYNDKAGDLNMGNLQGALSLSSIISLNDYQRLSAGVQGGFAQRSIDMSKAQWDAQFDGTGWNGALPSGEEGKYQDAFTFADFSGGIAWSYGTDESNMISNNELRANAGVSFYHINNPGQQFFLGTPEKLYGKLVAHGGLYIGVKNSVGAIIPSVMMAMQGPHREVNFGSLFRYMVKEESRYTGYIKETAILAGGYYRYGDAFTPALMFEFANFAVGVTYDINVSSLKTASNGRGGFEISLKYVNPNPFTPGEGTKSQVRFL